MFTKQDFPQVFRTWGGGGGGGGRVSSKFDGSGGGTLQTLRGRGGA